MTHKKGFLMKRGKKDKNFRSRLFQLDNREGTLKYFIKPDVRLLIFIFKISLHFTTFVGKRPKTRD